MRAGSLRHWVEVQAPTPAANLVNELEETWATIVSTWAAIEPVSSREKVEGGQVAAATTHTIRLRYDSSIELTTEHRIRWGARVFHITGIVNRWERNAELVLTAEERR